MDDKDKTRPETKILLVGFASTEGSSLLGAPPLLGTWPLVGALPLLGIQHLLGAPPLPRGSCPA